MLPVITNLVIRSTLTPSTDVIIHSQPDFVLDKTKFTKFRSRSRDLQWNGLSLST